MSEHSPNTGALSVALTCCTILVLNIHSPASEHSPNTGALSVALTSCCTILVLNIHSPATLSSKPGYTPVKYYSRWWILWSAYSTISSWSTLHTSLFACTAIYSPHSLWTFMITPWCLTRATDMNPSCAAHNFQQPTGQWPTPYSRRLPSCFNTHNWGHPFVRQRTRN